MSDGTITSTTDIIRHAPVVTVYTREKWADEWTEQPRVYADRVRFGSSPEGSSAVLSVDVGAGWDDTNVSIQHFEPLDLLGHYVKVEVQRQDMIDDGSGGLMLPVPFSWYGIITEDGGIREGAREYHVVDAGSSVGPGVARVLLRTQVFQAVGLEIIFDKLYVDKSYVQSETEAGELTVVKLPLTFNEKHHYEGSGNRTNFNVIAPNGATCYAFSRDLPSGVVWSTRDIVEYLVAFFQPADWEGETRLPIEIVDEGAILPDWDQPIVKVTGTTTVRQLLDKLLDRRRLLGWRITVNEETAPATIQIEVFSFVSTDIELPSGETQASNPNKCVIDFDSALDVRASLTKSDRHYADQVIVRGARKRSCFSLSHDDGTLVSDWKASDEADYENGPTSLPEREKDQIRAIIEYRRRDELRQVYAYFKVPDDWNFEVGNGTGGGSSSSSDGGDKLPIDPDLDETREWIYRPGLRFMRELLKEMSTTRGEDGAQDVPPPLAVIEVEDGTYRLVDKLAETAGMIDSGHGKGRSWSASLRMRTHCPGVIVRVSGAQQLAIADSDFGGDDDTDDQPSRLDWKDMIVTVAAEMFAHVEATYPADEDVEPAEQGDQKRVIVIDVDEAGRLDYVVPDTVISVDGSGDLVRHDGGYVRDDREWMRDMAKYVFTWYGTTRQAFRFEMQQVLDLLDVGQMITTVGTGELEEEVNSVVVGVTYDFVAQSTHVDTAFANLDQDVVLDWFRERRT